MSINVPGTATRTVHHLMDALGDDEYNFYQVDFTESSTKKVLLAMRVGVPQSMRETAAKIIRDNLEKADIEIAEIGDGKDKRKFDVPVSPDGKSVIRVTIKPGTGGGRGSKQTEYAESAQCLWCELVFNVPRSSLYSVGFPIVADPSNPAVSRANLTALVSSKPLFLAII